jgi:hypothetical protein
MNSPRSIGSVGTGKVNSPRGYKRGDFVTSKNILGKKVDFYISTRPFKKYEARVDGRSYQFGDNRYQHYKDSVSSAYSYLNHNDVMRRKSYQARHYKEGGKENFPSSGYLAYHFLW